MINMVDKQKIYKNLRYFSLFLLLIGVISIIYISIFYNNYGYLPQMDIHIFSGIILIVLGLICLFLEHIVNKIMGFRQDNQL